MIFEDPPNIKLFNEISLMEEREKLFYLPKQSPM